jgi:hypothetical protein
MVTVFAYGVGRVGTDFNTATVGTASLADS